MDMSFRINAMPSDVGAPLDPVPQNADVLVVDLDGTLLRSDMLFETFWSAFARDWTLPVKLLPALGGGKAALKRTLAERAEVDETTLPYNAEVLEYIADWRVNGGSAVLVTATDQALADRIAAHLDVFDAAYGSDGTHNLKGANKAAFLVETFGEGRFAYMGDHPADEAVWRHASTAVTVNAAQSLRHKAEQAAPAAEHLGHAALNLSPYLKALRPHQWIKNVLVFLPVLAAQQMLGATVLQALLAFVSFSLIASSVYVVNDLLDLKADRAHPRKCKRPFASGDIPLAHGTWMAAGLITGGAAIAAGLGGLFFVIMAGYFLLTTAYSLTLKRQPVIDICTLAGLYTLRIVAGGAATGIELSVWLLAFSIFFFFSLAAVKRQAELTDTIKRGDASASGRGYELNDLQIITMMAISSGYVSVMVMALYLNSLTVQQLYSLPEALWGICLVLFYWLSRTVMLAHRGQMHDDPVVYAAKDRRSQLCGGVVLLFALAAVFL